MSKVKMTLLLLSIGTFLTLGFLGTEPDQELHFVRVVHSDLSPARLWRNVDSLTRWPQWFYSLSEAQGPLDLKPGSLVTLNMDPKKGQRKRFSLQTEIIRLVPEREIAFRILSDSSSRSTKLFDQLEWEIQFLPDGSGTRIEGRAKAHTHHWKARILAKIAETIVMNQLFYPNLTQLGSLRQPFVISDGVPSSGMI